jgi:hypothetical protein
VPDGIVFPILNAISRFVRRVNGGGRLMCISHFLGKRCQQAYIQETTTAANNPQTMGKDVDCYISLHGLIEMYFAATKKD